MVQIPEGFEVVSSQRSAVQIPEGFEVVESSQAVSAPTQDLSYALEMEEVPAQEVAPQAQPERQRGLSERLIGAGETLLTVGTGATSGFAGQLIGAVEGIAEEIAAGNFGTREAADRIQEQAERYAQYLTYEPRTESGQQQLGAVGEALAPLEALPPSIQAPVISAAAGPAARQAAAGVMQTAGRAARTASPVVKQIADEIAAAAKKRVPEIKGRSVGAAQTPQELQRQITAESMPVPFADDAALTKGQATRNFEQLQFERETAKRGELGAPLRKRVENQTNTLIANLDAISDLSSPMRSEVRDIGMAVDDALVKRHKGLKKREKSLYDQAEKAGEMRERVQLDDVAGLFDALDEMEDVTSNAAAIKKNAIKRGIIAETDQGIESQPRTLSELERFRQFVNNATDITDPREARVRAVAISAIDDATENAGGDAYKKARQFSSKMRQEFENVGLTKKLLSEKRGTSERQIAFEDVFKKVMLDSSIEEINKLRSTLLKAGDDGKQAWADLKAKGIEHIKENAQSKSQMSEAGTPLLSPEKINKVIMQMDQGGKLEKIYGKRAAQAIRDLGELSKVIYTAPPGAINHSNTASALQVGLDSLGTFAVTGIPAPVVSTLKAGANYVRDKKLQKQIKESLNYLERKSQN